MHSLLQLSLSIYSASLEVTPSLSQSCKYIPYTKSVSIKELNTWRVYLLYILCSSHHTRIRDYYMYIFLFLRL